MMEHDDLFVQYLDRNILLETSALPAEAELKGVYSFSQTFEKRMEKLFQKARRHAPQPLQNNPPRRAFKRLVLVAIILAILVTMVIIAIGRENIRGFFVEVFEDFSNLVFTETTANPDETTTKTIEPEDLKLPAGYSEVSRSESSFYQEVFYKNDAGEIFSFFKSPADSMTFQIYIEGNEPEFVLIRHKEAIYYSKSGMQNLIWVENGYTIHLCGIISKDDLLKMVK